jgi:hypothetical protein
VLVLVLLAGAGAALAVWKPWESTSVTPAEPPAPPVTVDADSESDSTDTATDTPSSTTDTTDEMPDTNGSVPDNADLSEATFQTPTGNIACSDDLVDDALLCTVDSMENGAGQAVYRIEGDGTTSMARGKQAFPREIADAAPKLDYDKLWSDGRFWCTSTQSGLTCRLGQRGNGWFLSRQSQRHV